MAQEGKSSDYPTATLFGFVFARDRNSARCRQLSSIPFSYGPQLGPERHRAPELLFNPELVGLEDAGVHQVVVDSINRADLDLRKSLFGNVVLSGGGTLVKGELFEHRLELSE